MPCQFACVITPMRMRQKGFVRRTEGRLIYWHRAGSRKQQDGPVPDALIFIHGIGFGPTPYIESVEQMAAQRYWQRS